MQTEISLYFLKMSISHRHLLQENSCLQKGFCFNLSLLCACILEPVLRGPIAQVTQKMAFPMPLLRLWEVFYPALMPMEFKGKPWFGLNLYQPTVQPFQVTIP